MVIIPVCEVGKCWLVLRVVGGFVFGEFSIWCGGVAHIFHT